MEPQIVEKSFWHALHGFKDILHYILTFIIISLTLGSYFNVKQMQLSILMTKMHYLTNYFKTIRHNIWRISFSFFTQARMCLLILYNIENNIGFKVGVGKKNWIFVFCVFYWFVFSIASVKKKSRNLKNFKNIFFY